MAKKGYQQRDGLNCNETDHLNDDNLCRSRSPGAKTNKTKANGKKNRQRSGHALTRKKSDDENLRLPQQMANYMIFQGASLLQMFLRK